MKAVRAFGPKQLQVIELSEPEPKENEVKIAVRVCGICGSDKWFWQVKEPVDYIAGHEVSGEVVSIGSGVRHLRPGDRIALNNVKGCGSCSACAEGSFVRCEASLEHMGYGFSEYVVAPERNCLLLDDNISFEKGCLIFDNWGTPYAALERTDLQPGDFVLVAGCGPIGLSAIALAKLRGGRVIAMDPLEYRRNAALRQGAEYAVEPGEAAAETIRKITNGTGIRIVLECSGKQDSYRIAFDSLAVGGALVAIGEGAVFEINVSKILINKHISFLGTLYSTMEQGRQVQKLMTEGKIRPLEIVTDRFTLEELPVKFGTVFDARDGLLKSVVLT